MAESPPAEATPAIVRYKPAIIDEDATAAPRDADPASAVPATTPPPANAVAPAAATTTRVATPSPNQELAWWLLIPVTALLLWAGLRTSRTARARRGRDNHDT